MIGINESAWFTVEPLDSDTYAISEYGHWEEVHSYLLLGRERAALIDSGLGIGDVFAVVRALTNLPVTVLTSHVHWDHIGGHASFEDIRVHPADREWLECGIPIPLEQIRRDVDPTDFTRPVPEGFRADEYRPFTGAPSGLLHDGDRFDLGGRTIEILHTPGHSPGHLCFFDRDRGYLATGDLLYRGTLYAFYPSTDPTAFAQSARRIASLIGIRRVLPGHHDLDIPVTVVNELADAFRELDRKELVRHGTGLHNFSHFAIQL